MRYSNEDFEASKFLGNAVGKNNPFMRSIACMGNEERQIAGYIEAVKILGGKRLTKKQKDVVKLLGDVVQKLGQSTFNMDIVSHLSMKADVDEGTAEAH